MKSNLLAILTRMRNALESYKVSPPTLIRKVNVRRGPK
jgi:hypothetical protein